MTPFIAVAYQKSWTSDSYIMIHNSEMIHLQNYSYELATK